MEAVVGNHRRARRGAPNYKFGVIGDRRVRKPPAKKHSFVVSGVPFEIDIKYAPVQVLGKGSYGVVCSCINRDTGESVAVKKIGNALSDTPTALSTLREIQILRQIDHKNVISLKDVMVSSSKADFSDVYLVHDLMEADLGRVINSLTGDHCKYFLFQILSGLEYLHSARIIHRDLKPQNLLMDSKMNLKICDFGLARTKSSSSQSMTEYMTTRWYRAPEILLSSVRYGSEVDIWSVGCIFAEMLGGTPIFQGSDSLDQIRRIQRVVGTQPASELKFIHCERSKKFLMGLPFSPRLDLGRLFPAADPLAVDLLRRMLILNPKKRISALEGLKHPYFSEIFDPSTEELPVKKVKLPVDKYPEAVEDQLLRDLIWEEMLLYHPEHCY